MNISIVQAPELLAVEPSKAKQIQETFEPMVKMLEQFESYYEQVVSEAEIEVTQELTEKARRLRLDIAKIRISADKARKEKKAKYLLAGRAIDGVSNILKWAVAEKEDKLKEIENFFVEQEQLRLQAIQNERVALLSPYVQDASEKELFSMSQDIWEAYLSIKIKEHNDRIEAEKKAEEERLRAEQEKAEELERIQVQNKMLLKALEEKEAEKKAEAQAKEKALLEQEKAAAKERLAYAEKLEQERKKRIEAEQREQQSIREQQEKERKAKEAEEARIQEELSKGDAEKMKDLVLALQAITSQYAFKSAKNRKIYAEIVQTVENILQQLGK